MVNTSFHICGFWFHVNWDGNEGTDQQGGKWTNPKNPRPSNPKLIDTILDVSNSITKELK